MEAVWTWIQAWMSGGVVWLPSPAVVSLVLGLTGILKLLSKIPFLAAFAGGNVAKVLAVAVAFFVAFSAAISDGSLDGNEVQVVVKALLAALGAMGVYIKAFSATARAGLGK